MADETPAGFQPYPAKRYPVTGDPKYVQNAADDAALGKGWFDSPKKAAAKAGKADKADKE